MKIIKNALAGVLATVAMTTASAAPIPVTETFTPAGGSILINSATGYDFTFDIRDLFTVGSDLLSDITLKFNFTDTNVQGQNNEDVRITLGSLTTGQVFTVNGNNDVNNGNGNTTTKSVMLSADTIADLTDGLLSVRVAAASGSYIFLNAQLGANVSVAEPGEVPEPFTLGLIGIALAGAGFASRRKKV